MTLNLYTFFHLNLMFSSVEVKQRCAIVERCYWPLLRLARKYSLPLGIEASGCTLEIIQEIDSHWISELRDLIINGTCELIGSGYAQVIGPLVPHSVNQANFRLGMECYQSILGVKPRIALVNEQAYSAGLVPLYLDAGFKALIMEWNNPSRSYPDWNHEWSYYAQQAIGVDGSQIGLIWNQSIAFQKFQRYAHGELELDEYLGYIHTHKRYADSFFPLYGNDAEVFDFRPGRFMTEAPIQTGEWERIAILIESLLADPTVKWVSPSEVLDKSAGVNSRRSLQLESSQQPIPVKKQDKYNILRWALTGRDDLEINSRCHRLTEALCKDPNSEEADWKELCYLWSSDFRTHITTSRWNAYKERLKALEKRLPTLKTTPALPQPKDATSPNWERDGRWITVNTKHIQVRFNCKRGMAIEHYIDRRICSRPLFGTLHHGHFNDISWGADYYSGHLFFQAPGSHQITDLQAVEPHIEVEGSCIVISSTIETPLGLIQKKWTCDSDKHILRLHIGLDWPDAGAGRLRIVPFTLFPDIFDLDTLTVSGANGGNEHEIFTLGRHSIDHGRAISFLISSHQCLGLTDGIVRLGDKSNKMQIEFNPGEAALKGQVQHQQVDDAWFTRFLLSARELDDTSKQKGLKLNTCIEIKRSLD